MKNATVTTTITTQKRLENFGWITTADTVLEPWNIDMVKSYVSEENLKKYSRQGSGIKALYEYTEFGFLPISITNTQKTNDGLRIIITFKYTEI